MPALLGWPYAGIHPELRKTFEVAVHAGSALALVGILRRDVRTVAREHRAGDALRAAFVLAPSLLAGLLLERVVTERGSTPRGVATAQVAAGLAMAAADRRRATRRYGTARLADHLALGLSQAAALVPGVSRNGSTLTGARLRGFERPAAARLSRQAALPVVAGAAVLKGARLAKRGLPRDLAAPFATGLGAATISTLVSRRLLDRMEQARSYLPLAAYRVALGSLGLACLPRRPGPSGGALQ